MPRTIRVFTRNAAFQHIETLRRNREKRHQNREFFVEGVRAINQALSHHWRITAFVFARDANLSRWARDILAASPAERHYELPLELLKELSGKDETSELIALVEMPPDEWSRLPVREDLLIVVFDRPSSPGNLGTLIRSCDAFGVNGLVVTGHAVDVYSPETIKATTGSLFAVPVVRKSSAKELEPWLAEMRRQLGDLQIVGTDEKGTRDLDAHGFAGPTILMIGNETRGLSRSHQEMCDAIVCIPMVGSASSLNVASAASIALYEIGRQRRMQRGAPEH